MPNHHPLHIASLGVDYVASVNRHRVTIFVVLERGRPGAHPFKLGIEIEVPGWDAPEQRSFVRHSRIVREISGAVFRRNQSVLISLSGDALHPSFQYAVFAGERAFNALA